MEAADFAATSLEDRLPGIAPNSGAGLWVAPVQRIAPTSVRVPLDLVYLDCNSVVLDAIESFPISQSTALSAPAASMLVLPAETIASTGTQRGDRLLLCVPEEMKLRLLGMEAPDGETGSAAYPRNDTSEDDELNKNPAGNVLRWVDRFNTRASTDATRSASAPVQITVSDPEVPVAGGPALIEIAPADVDESAAPAQPDEAPVRCWKATPSKNWLQRLLKPEPSDPRKAPRTVLPWLVAYFFTGGSPAARGIRDISATGMFVVTEDRWYPGTVVRITLTDQRNPTAERSFTLNAEVIRSGADGVGFRFVLRDGKDERNASAPGVDRQVPGVYRAEVEKFLLRMRSGDE